MLKQSHGQTAGPEYWPTDLMHDMLHVKTPVQAGICINAAPGLEKYQKISSTGSLRYPETQQHIWTGNEFWSKGRCAAQRIIPPPKGSSPAAQLPWCPRFAAGVQQSAHPRPPGCCSPARHAYVPALQPGSNKSQPGVHFQGCVCKSPAVGGKGKLIPPRCVSGLPWSFIKLAFQHRADKLASRSRAQVSSLRVFIIERGACQPLSWWLLASSFDKLSVLRPAMQLQGATSYLHMAPRYPTEPYSQS